MSETLHFIVTEDSGRTFRLPFSKKKFQLIAATSCIALTGLIAVSCFSFNLIASNRSMSIKMTEMEQRLAKADSIVAEIQRSKKEQSLELSLQVANLELTNARQEAVYKEERAQIISNAVNDLKERSELIESVMGGIGIKVSDKTVASNTSNKGGPYIAYPEGEDPNKLLSRADKYLATIKKLPIGRPTAGSITSHYGRRTDPINGRSALHAGTDFRGKIGAKIYVTGDGVVESAYYSKSYGNYVVINHGNGYKTSFAHMQKYLVQKGDRVTRGQIVGLLGNTGRSTGPHLHYEIHHNNRPINPKKFLALKVPETKKIASVTKKINHVQ